MIPILYGFTIWAASVLYALIANPAMAGIAICMAPITVSGAAAVVLVLEIIVHQTSKVLARILPERRDSNT